MGSPGPGEAQPQAPRSRGLTCTGDREGAATADGMRGAVHLQPGLPQREVAAQTHASQDPGMCPAPRALRSKTLPSLPRIPAQLLPGTFPGAAPAPYSPGPASSSLGPAPGNQESPPLPPLIRTSDPRSPHGSSSPESRPVTAPSPGSRSLHAPPTSGRVGKAAPIGPCPVWARVPPPPGCALTPSPPARTSLPTTGQATRSCARAAPRC